MARRQQHLAKKEAASGRGHVRFVLQVGRSQATNLKGLSGAGLFAQGGWMLATHHRAPSSRSRFSSSLQGDRRGRQVLNQCRSIVALRAGAEGGQGASPKSISIAAFRAGGPAGRGGREQIGRSSQIAGAQQKQGAGCRCCVAKEMQTLSLVSGGGRGCPGGNVAPALVDRRTLGRTGGRGGTRRLHLAGSSRRWVEGATDRRCRCPPTALSFARVPCSVLRSDGGPGEGTGLLVPASLCWREVASGRASFKHFLRRSNPR